MFTKSPVYILKLVKKTIDQSFHAVTYVKKKKNSNSNTQQKNQTFRLNVNE